ncbi:MAG: hypothetical protein J6Y37_06725 [Paludibacteraceae bacterium]|nr:hypothetical protein [Paludibacteraceae bacterium]
MMNRSVIRTVLVIGDDPETIAKKYSADTEVESHLKLRRSDAASERQRHLSVLENILDNRDILELSVSQIETYKSEYHTILGMDDFVYYLHKTEGCYYDVETGDAYTTENPNAHYKCERCYQNRLTKFGEEGQFSNPMWLNDGSKSYSARLDDICWERNHLYGPSLDVYRRAWEVVVDGDEPVDERERKIKAQMSPRYFLNFGNKDEYAIRSCSFCCYGVATEDSYTEITYKDDDAEWEMSFYDRFVKGLNGNPLLTIYEVRSLED